jgi:integrase
VFVHPDGRRIKDFRAAWSRATKDAGYPGILVHDYRRTYVRMLERSGVARSSAMAMVGHKTEAIYRRYAIADAKSLQEAAAKVATFRARENNVKDDVKDTQISAG